MDARSDAQHGGGDGQINKQGQCVDDGGHEEIGHDGGIEAQLFGQNGEGEAHQLGHKNGGKQGEADHDDAVLVSTAAYVHVAIEWLKNNR